MKLVAVIGINELYLTQIKETLAPYAQARPTDTFEQWVHTAYNDGAHLSAEGFYIITPALGFDFEKGIGTPFRYYSVGAACSEVELDVLTGEYRVLRADILMDVGATLSPAIDIGQIEGLIDIMI